MRFYPLVSKDFRCANQNITGVCDDGNRLVKSYRNSSHTFIKKEHFQFTPLGVNCNCNDSETRLSVLVTQLMKSSIRKSLFPRKFVPLKQTHFVDPFFVSYLPFTVVPSKIKMYLFPTSFRHIGFYKPLWYCGELERAIYQRIETSSVWIFVRVTTI